MYTVVLFCWLHSDSASVLLYFTFESRVPKMTSVHLRNFGTWAWKVEREREIFLFNVTCNDISVIYVKTHRYAGGLKKLKLT